MSSRNLVKVRKSSTVSTLTFILSFLDVTVKSLVMTSDISRRNSENFVILAMNSGGILGALSFVCD